MPPVPVWLKWVIVLVIVAVIIYISITFQDKIKKHIQGGAALTAACPTSDNGVACFGNGTCVSGVCQCEAGWTGAACNQINHNCPFQTINGHKVQCSGNGSCVKGVCVCDPNHIGSNCETKIEYCPKDAEGNVCGGNGTCTGDTCECDDGRTGSLCQYEGQCWATENGICDGNPCVDGVCQCPENTYGPLCTESAPDVCPSPNGQTCSGHGTCESGECVCDAGFVGYDCSLTCPTNPVTGEVCSGFGSCYVTESYEAACACGATYGQNEYCGGCASGFTPAKVNADATGSVQVSVTPVKPEYYSRKSYNDIKARFKNVGPMACVPNCPGPFVKQSSGQFAGLYVYHACNSDPLSSEPGHGTCHSSGSSASQTCVCNQTKKDKYSYGYCVGDTMPDAACAGVPLTNNPQGSSSVSASSIPNIDDANTWQYAKQDHYLPATITILPGTVDPRVVMQKADDVGLPQPLNYTPPSFTTGDTNSGNFTESGAYVFNTSTFGKTNYDRAEANVRGQLESMFASRPCYGAGKLTDPLCGQCTYDENRDVEGSGGARCKAAYRGQLGRACPGENTDCEESEQIDLGVCKQCIDYDSSTCRNLVDFLNPDNESQYSTFQMDRFAAMHDNASVGGVLGETGCHGEPAPIFCDGDSENLGCSLTDLCFCSAPFYSLDKENATCAPSKGDCRVFGPSTNQFYNDMGQNGVPARQMTCGASGPGACVPLNVADGASEKEIWESVWACKCAEGFGPNYNIGDGLSYEPEMNIPPNNTHRVVSNLEKANDDVCGVQACEAGRTGQSGFGCCEFHRYCWRESASNDTAFCGNWAEQANCPNNCPQVCVAKGYQNDDNEYKRDDSTGDCYSWYACFENLGIKAWINCDHPPSNC